MTFAKYAADALVDDTTVELPSEEEAARSKNYHKAILWTLAGLGGVAAASGIGYLAYKNGYLKPVGEAIDSITGTENWSNPGIGMAGGASAAFLAGQRNRNRFTGNATLHSLARQADESRIVTKHPPGLNAWGIFPDNKAGQISAEALLQRSEAFNKPNPKKPMPAAKYDILEDLRYAADNKSGPTGQNLLYDLSRPDNVKANPTMMDKLKSKFTDVGLKLQKGHLPAAADATMSLFSPRAAQADRLIRNLENASPAIKQKVLDHYGWTADEAAQHFKNMTGQQRLGQQLAHAGYRGAVGGALGLGGGLLYNAAFAK